MKITYQILFELLTKQVEDKRYSPDSVQELQSYERDGYTAYQAGFVIGLIDPYEDYE